METEKRMYKRFRLELAARYSILSQLGSSPYTYEEPSRLKDISQSGLAMFTREKVAPNTMVRVKTKLPSPPFNIVVLGKSVRCEYIDELKRYVVGVKFIGHLPLDIGKIIRTQESKLAST